MFKKSLLAALFFSINCGAPVDVSQPVTPLAQAISSESDDAALAEGISAQVDTYVQGLLHGDTESVQKVISTELTAKITTRGPAGSSAEKLARFVAREQKKLHREIIGARGPAPQQESPRPMVKSLQYQDNGRVVQVTLTLNGSEIPKPFYLVREGSSYKVNVTVPAGDTAAFPTDIYRVKNDDTVSRTFSCTSNGPYSIGRSPAERKVKCLSSCNAWGFDGTTFEAMGAETDCDYNTWGIDMHIIDGLPFCSDPC